MINAFVIVVAVVVVSIFSGAEASHRQNHFGDPCYLCDCYVKYEDRDQTTGLAPYKVALNGYDTTEDQCLLACISDEDCRAVVYGLIGGRSVFTCELYTNVGTQQAIYTPYSNLYVKKVAKCQKQTQHLRAIDLTEADGSVLERKLKYVKFQQKLNPFFHGKR